MKSAEADLFICMGSSMRVNPANMLPATCKMSGGKIVMINLQKTPADWLCEDNGIIINQFTDPIMDMTMNKLGWPIQDWRRTYRLRMSMNSADNKSMSIRGVDSNGCNYVLFKELKIVGLNHSAVTFDNIRCQRQPLPHVIQKTNVESFKVYLQMYGHYFEPRVELTVPMDKLTEARSLDIEMVYHLKTRTWESAKFMSSDAEHNELGDAQFNSIPYDYSTPG